MTKLPESENDRRCVILEVIHKPLELSDVLSACYLDSDEVEDDAKRGTGKLSIRSSEQLREQMEQGVAEQMSQGDSFRMKYIFYAPPGAIWTKGAIKVICSPYVCGIRWQVREEMGVDDVEISEIFGCSEEED
ncbi:hypothetical protein AAMO2058_001211000 [Amorphochlora amoebiformis]